MNAELQKWVAILVVVGLCLMFGRQSFAESWLDDFGDGNAGDGMPVSWLVDAVAQGSYNVVGGDYVATGSNANVGDEVMSSGVPSAIFGDVSIQAQAMVTGAGAFAVWRSGVPAYHGYGGYINSEGTVGIYRTDGDILDPATPLVVLGSTNVGFTSSADVKLQFDIRGSNLSVTAWRADQPKPLLPQVRVSDSRYTSGYAGVAFQENANAPTATASFRYVQAVAIPEPSTLLAAVLAEVISIGFHRKRRRAALSR
jgi:hypothetical protein